MTTDKKKKIPPNQNPKQKAQQLMLVTTKRETNLQTRVLFNFHVMEDMGQSLYRKVLIESESPCDVKMCEKRSCISNIHLC